MLFTLLTVLFVGLKLGSIIAWSWWFVLMPTIIHMSLIGALVVLGSLIQSKK